MDVRQYGPQIFPPYGSGRSAAPAASKKTGPETPAAPAQDASEERPQRVAADDREE